MRTGINDGPPNSIIRHDDNAKKEAASVYKMYVWRRQPSYTVMAHATSVAAARALALEECSGSGCKGADAGGRKEAYIHVETRNPEIFYRENAEFVLTDSAELQEMEAYCAVLAERLRELTGVAGISIEQFRAIKHKLQEHGA
jgi:hypothetical protein